MLVQQVDVLAGRPRRAVAHQPVELTASGLRLGHARRGLLAGAVGGRGHLLEVRLERADLRLGFAQLLLELAVRRRLRAARRLVELLELARPLLGRAELLIAPRQRLPRLGEGGLELADLRLA